jgi:hypothetical protein
MWLIGLLVIVVVGYIVYRVVTDKNDAAFDSNPVVHKVEEELKSVLDVNKDGKVNVEDAKEAGKKVKAGAKKAAGKAKAAAGKAKSKLKVAK